VGADEVVDFFDEVGGGIERAATNSALSDEGEACGWSTNGR
jgi:hypothetical protein